MTQKPVIATITMEDAGQSIGASATTYYAALAFAEVAAEAPLPKPKTVHPPTPAMQCTHDRSCDIALNLC